MRKFKTVNELVNSLKPECPVYCIRLNEIKKSVKFFKDNFPGKILYAVKTNPNEKIIKQIIVSGVEEFDVASLNEIKLIKKINTTSIHDQVYMQQYEGALPESGCNPLLEKTDPKNGDPY